MPHESPPSSKSRRLVLKLGGGTVLGTLLAACGGGGGADAAAAAPQQPPPAGPSSSANVAMTLPADAPRIARDFAGLSIEKAALSYPLLSGENGNMVGLFNRLGAGVLRIGGNSSDASGWQRTGPDETSGVITPAAVDRLASFVQACRWRVIYGLNFVGNDPATIADEAAYAAQALGVQLAGFEIGNEPDLYAQHGLAPNANTYPGFVSRWTTFANAIRAAVPDAVFTGPATAWNYQRYTVPFASDAAGLVSLLTQHHYRNPDSATIEAMLSPDPSLAPMLQVLQGAASARGIGFRLAETNSYWGGGKPGVSDAHASALWVINFLFAVAQGGASGVNLHTGGGASYSAIKTNKTAGTVAAIGPEYYGIYLFNQAAGGRLMQTRVDSAGTTLFAHAVAADGGGVRLILVNTDANSGYDVAVDCSSVPNARAGIVTTLGGPSLGSLTGTQIDGATFALDGSGAPQGGRPVACVNGVLGVHVASASALLVDFA
ncbi:lipoprotein [Burkholderia pseudomallei]|nr:glycoside hydrolase 44 family protein [Burkholderia pseudomallei]EIF76464.1 hypothetical protein BP354E_1603 [Burkholderia pseudomallei 354e]EIF80838.1 hypothetical protein BP354A_1972 [Burkholderia pseudomallei 354a]KGV15661.1 glycoside hydrolase 44 family protein [Burkholderia pseudomallei MSHR4300]CAJ3650292.1 lipoprotein [Burkholderia pseudomallei]